VKRSGLGGDQQLIYAAPSSTDTSHIRFDDDNTLHVFEYTTGFVWQVKTSQVFRDTSSWYHIVVSVDTTQATASNRVKIYVNGTQVTAFGTATYPSQNADTEFNNTVGHAIGRNDQGASNYFSGYLADIYFIDGQALTPSSFTETDATTGQLIPLAYTGSYGTNGFHLEFSDNSGTTSTTLGKDSAGSNNWTPNNFSVSSGAGNDSLVDVPVNGDQTDTGVGGEVRGNYCVLNPLDKSSVATLSNGNLDVSTSATHGLAVASIMVSSGKYYAEYVATTLNAGNGLVGVCNPLASRTSYLGGTTGGVGYGFGGDKWVDGSNTGGLTSATTGDVIGIALDKDNNEVKFYKNNTLILTQTGLNSSQPYTFAMGHSSNAGTFNFGQRAFAYTAPSGFKALNTANLPAPLVTKPSTVMDVVLYTGTGSALTPTSTLGFNPDLVWIKSRSAATDHALYDSVRGVEKRLESNNTDAEVTSDGGVTAFNSAGFSVGTLAQVNTSSATYAAWTWDAGTTTDTNNTAGSITSSVRANATAGFSVVSVPGYTYPTKTAGHGLGVEPHFIITKSRGVSNPWIIYHKSAGANTYFQFDTGAGYTGVSGVWSGVSSTVFPLNSGVNQQTDIIAYCFAPVVGYSSFGTYVANNSADGPFVYLGFRPKFVMVKCYDSTSGWGIYDSARGSYNTIGDTLLADSANQENNPDYGNIDFLSNGFKIRSGSGYYINNTPDDFIYCAWAESPFNYARAR
jgi:hypothetical protein